MKIKSKMPLIDVMLTLAQNNHMALQLVKQLIKTEPNINPDVYKNHNYIVFALDKKQIYGDDIVILYYLCQKDMPAMHALLQATPNELGGQNLRQIIKDKNVTVIPVALKNVQARLQRFAKGKNQSIFAPLLMKNNQKQCMGR